jgi:hypothetical protein
MLGELEYERYRGGENRSCALARRERNLVGSVFHLGSGWTSVIMSGKSYDELDLDLVSALEAKIYGEV